MIKMPIKNLAVLLLSISLLQGCVAAAVVAVTSGAGVAVDKRTLGKQIDDQRIELAAHNDLSKHQALQDNTNLQIVSVNGSVLVVGQAPNSYLRDLAIKTITSVNGVLHVHNQIRISNEISFTTKTNDLWLTSKVKTALFAAENISASNIKVVTENGEVFLLGLISSSQANEAVDIARNIGGVNRVFKMFEFTKSL
ncbi:MAG: osmotically-inducible protein OsmY [Alteromonadaceae bacterium]|jgi:osmotically-inducible protein OsmY